MTKLSEVEMNLLKSMAGDPVVLPWGAALGAAMEYLVTTGHIRRDERDWCYTYLLTEKGLDAVYPNRTENKNAE